MPHILIDARSIADNTCGGINKVARLWILAQTKITEPQNCTCVTTGLKPSPEVNQFCADNNFKYYHIKIPNKLWTLLCFFNFSSLILTTEKKLKTKFDLILLPNLAYTGALYKPYHILVHDISFIIEPKWFNLRRRLWHKYVNAPSRIKNADEIHCVSHQTKSDCTRLLNVPESKCKIFNFNPTSNLYNIKPTMYECRSSWLPPTAIKFALMLGGSDPRKNIKTALKAIQLYNLQNPQNYLTPIVLGGSVYFKNNEQNISYIQSPGFISDKELTWLYQNAKVLLYPSWYEGFGLPLHEAAQFDTPIIASTAGALSETAPKGAILCNPAKINEWMVALQLSQSNATQISQSNATRRMSLFAKEG